MRLNNKWHVIELGDEFVAVPVDDGTNDFKGVIKLNSTAKEIWDGLSEGLDEYAIALRITEKNEGLSVEKALEDVTGIINKLKEEGFIEE